MGRGTSPSGRMVRACPRLASGDIARSVAFYRDRLGFRVLMNDPHYGIVQRDAIELHFWPCPDRHIAENTACYIDTDDVDRLHDGLRRIGVRMSAPRTKPWGMREFEVWDEDGNLLVFGQEADKEPVVYGGPVDQDKTEG